MVLSAMPSARSSTNHGSLPLTPSKSINVSLSQGLTAGRYVLANKLPFDLSKQIDFNVGSNQFKVGQKYTDVITITTKDKVRICFEKTNRP